MKHNPFEKNILYHYYLTYQLLGSLKSQGKLLDYGSGKGEFLKNLKNTSLDLYGYDVDRDLVKEVKDKYPFVHFAQGSVEKPLPYKNNFFDIVCMFHVLEHVPSEKKSIEEVYRVLKKGGIFFLASPYKGIFSFADTANARYKFPILHRIVSNLILGKKEYERRFITKRKEKLFGDSSISKKWHTRYTEKQIDDLLNEKFEIVSFYKFSLFHPFLLVAYNIYNYVTRHPSSFINEILWIDNHIFAKNASYNMFIVAKKK